MSNNLSRREMLRLCAVTGAGILLEGCAQRPCMLSLTPVSRPALPTPIQRDAMPETSDIYATAESLMPRPCRLGGAGGANYRPTLKLDGRWQFCLDPEDQGIDGRWYMQPPEQLQFIEVPGNWNAQGFGGWGPGHSTDPFALQTGQSPAQGAPLKGCYYGPAWYFLRVPAPDLPSGARMVLKFGAASPMLALWVNGVFIGARHGSGTAFCYDVTSTLKAGDNLIAVRMDNRLEKAALYSHLHWYAMWGGLYDSVELQAVPSVYIDAIRVIPYTAAGEIWVSTDIAGQVASSENLNLEIRVQDATGKTVAHCRQRVSLTAAGATTVESRLPLPKAQLWSPDSPYLYSLEARLLGTRGKVIDGLNDRFGLRTIRVDGRRVLLNEKPILVLAQHYNWCFVDTISPPVDKAWYARTFRAMREYGFNYLRVPWFMPQAALDAADEVGIMLQIEGSYINFRYLNTPVETALRYLEWTELIAENFNHPSLVTYCLSNEHWYQDPELAAKDWYKTAIPQELIRYMREMDGTRLLLDSDGVKGEWRPSCDLWTSHALPGAVANWFEMYMRNIARVTAESEAHPVVEHEYLNVPSFWDVSLIDQFKGAIGAPQRLVALRDWLEQEKLSDKAPAWLQASYQLQRMHLEAGLEVVRKHPYRAGYSMCAWSDLIAPEITWGVCNIFQQPKGMSAADFRRYNADVALLAHLPDRTGKITAVSSAMPPFVYEAGTRMDVAFVVSNYGASTLSKARLRWQLVRGGQTLVSGEVSGLDCTLYEVTELSPIEIVLPNTEVPYKAELQAELAASSARTANRWYFWVFPADGKERLARFLASVRVSKMITDQLRGLGVTIDGAQDSGIMLTDDAEEAIDFADGGGKALLVRSGVLGHVSYARGIYPGWFLHYDHHIGSAVASHPALGNFPHDGYVDWQFRSLLIGAIPFSGRSVEHDGQSFQIEPIISGPMISVQRFRALSPLFETKINQGSLLVCTLRLLNDTPEGTWLLGELLRYVRGDQFNPKAHSGRAAALAALCPTATV